MPLALPGAKLQLLAPRSSRRQALAQGQLENLFRLFSAEANLEVRLAAPRGFVLLDIHMGLCLLLILFLH